MSKIILNGKKEAEKVALFLEDSEKILGKSLVIIQCDGHLEKSFYVRLKTEMGERLGAMVMVIPTMNKEEVTEAIRDANLDDTVDGILVQLPIFGASREEVEQILCSIYPSKDIDGLNPKSRFSPAVVRATERVIDKFKVSKVDKIAVVGSLGMVGKRMKERLEALGFSVTGFDKGDDLNKLIEFTVIISVTGVSGIIKPEMVKEGFVGIDLGYPKGDLSPEAMAKADLLSPVPNGVGPLTVISLFENLAEV